jgi:hypothetical protein
VRSADPACARKGYTIEELRVEERSWARRGVFLGMRGCSTLVEDGKGHAGLEAVARGTAKAAGEFLPKRKGDIEAAPASAAGAAVHDGGVSGVAVIADADILVAPRVGGGAGGGVVGGGTEAVDGKSNNHLSVVDGLTASTGAAAEVVHG